MTMNPYPGGSYVGEQSRKMQCLRLGIPLDERVWVYWFGIDPHTGERTHAPGGDGLTSVWRQMEMMFVFGVNHRKVLSVFREFYANGCKPLRFSEQCDGKRYRLAQALFALLGRQNSPFFFEIRLNELPIHIVDQCGHL